VRPPLQATGCGKRACNVGSIDFDIFLEIQYASCVLVWP
jgi:hypothetical protein